MARRYRYTSVDDPDFLGSLNDELDEVTRRVDLSLSGKEQVIATTIRAVGTAIPHRLGRIPKIWSVALKEDARWWEYKARSPEFVYLKANIDVEAEVTLGG